MISVWIFGLCGAIWIVAGFVGTQAAIAGVILMTVLFGAVVAINYILVKLDR